jgi:hypothetical protein
MLLYCLILENCDSGNFVGQEWEFWRIDAGKQYCDDVSHKIIHCLCGWCSGTISEWSINQLINSPIIPLRNIGRPQESSTALYSSRHTWSLPKSISFLWPLLAPFFAMCSSVSLYPVYLGGSTLGLVWLYLLSVSAIYGPAIPTCVS